MTITILDKGDTRRGGEMYVISHSESKDITYYLLVGMGILGG